MGGRYRGPGPERGAGAGARRRLDPSAPAPSVFARLWDWLTVEVSDEQEPVDTAPDDWASVSGPWSAGVEDPLGSTLPIPPLNESAFAQAGFDTEDLQASRQGHERISDADGPRTDTGDRRTTALTGRNMRSEALVQPAARSRRRALAAVALLALCAIAVLAVRAGYRGPRPTTVTASPVAATPAHTTSATARPSSAAGTAAATPSRPDCAAMKMQPVPSGAPAGHPVVQGLCYTLGGGTAWLVGCAPGFQTACDPSLQAVIDCLRQVGAKQQGAIDERNVLACDVPVGSTSGGT